MTDIFKPSADQFAYYLRIIQASEQMGSGLEAVIRQVLLDASQAFKAQMISHGDDRYRAGLSDGNALGEAARTVQAGQIQAFQVRLAAAEAACTLASDHTQSFAVNKLLAAWHDAAKIDPLKGHTTDASPIPTHAFQVGDWVVYPHHPKPENKMNPGFVQDVTAFVGKAMKVSRLVGNRDIKTEEVNQFVFDSAWLREATHAEIRAAYAASPETAASLSTVPAIEGHHYRKRGGGTFGPMEIYNSMHVPKLFVCNSIIVNADGTHMGDGTHHPDDLVEDLGALSATTPVDPHMPPLGIMPRSIWIEHRVADIARAVARYQEFLDRHAGNLHSRVTYDVITDLRYAITKYARGIAHLEQMSRANP